MSGRRAAQVAAVSNEIRQMESAIAAFHNQYGVDPPSQVTLYEVGGAWDGYSMNLIRRMWPNFDFTISRDINLDGVSTGTFTLYGPECITFFLGGLPLTTSNGAGKAPTFTTIGFSKNPANPFFCPTNGTVYVPSDMRDGPYFEFKPSRLTASANASGFFDYLDPIPSQTMPYMYASSYEGQSYQDNNALTYLQTLSPARSTDLQIGGNTAMALVYYIGATGQAQKPKGFQIISPGRDNTYGAGGTFDPNQTDGGLSNINDFDNITNFATGQLVPNR
jgi:hypothetical protein